MTYIATAEGWLYVATVLDFFSRRIVGWAMDEHMSDELTQRALQIALRQRKPLAYHLLQLGPRQPVHQY